MKKTVLYSEKTITKHKKYTVQGRMKILCDNFVQKKYFKVVNKL